VLDGVGHSRAALEAQHHKLHREAVRTDLPEEWRVEGAQPARLRLLPEKLTCFLNLLSDDLLNVLHERSLQGPV